MKTLLSFLFLLFLAAIANDASARTITKLGAFKNNGDIFNDINGDGEWGSGEGVLCLGCVDWYWAKDVTGESFQAGRDDTTGDWWDGDGNNINSFANLRLPCLFAIAQHFKGVCDFESC